MATQAFFWGIISAISLPLGALLGLLWRPGSRISSAFMAFGAGALLFALSIELLGHVPHFVAEYGLNALAVAIAGALAGGAIFDVLNQLLNNRGAFLRNLSNAKNHVARTKKARAKRLLRRLYRVAALKKLPPENMAHLVKVVHKARYHDGDIIFCTGDQAQELYFIRRGQVKIVVRRDDTDERVINLGKNDMFGELALLNSNSQRYVDASAVGDVELYTLEKEDLDRALAELPQLQQAVRALAKTRHQQWLGGERQDDWVDEAEDQLDNLNMPITENDIREESAAASGAAGAAMAIWLGIAIDGVPESLVIGTLAIGPEGMSLAFIVGVFLANLPESMSSAVSMRKNGMSRRRIMTMWGSLCLLTGVGAWLGAVVFPPDPQGVVFYIKLAIEALAAGAMLTMIAETMLPEAFEEGGSIIGFATLCGFLTALAVASV